VLHGPYDPGSHRVPVEHFTKLARDRRTWLGLRRDACCAQMEHSCDPSARVSVAPESLGNVVSLTTRRDVRAGEALSIAYVCSEWPRVERRHTLLCQHGFVCRCPRCETEGALQETERLEPFFPKLLASVESDGHGASASPSLVEVAEELLHWPAR
jgi:hypothetical protein